MRDAHTLFDRGLHIALRPGVERKVVFRPLFLLPVSQIRAVVGHGRCCFLRRRRRKESYEAVQRRSPRRKSHGNPTRHWTGTILKCTDTFKVKKSKKYGPSFK